MTIAIESSVSSSSSDHLEHDEVEGRDVLEKIVNAATDAQAPRRSAIGIGGELLSSSNSSIVELKIPATWLLLWEMNPEYFWNLQYRAELTAEEKEKIANLLYKYRGCFATSLTDVRRTKLLERQIRVPEGNRPVYPPGLKRFSQP